VELPEDRDHKGLLARQTPLDLLAQQDRKVSKDQ
jgi:hypothetical protein